MKVVHIITRMILGGAQENTLYTVQGLQQKPGYDVTLITGPALGPEGELIEEARRSGVRLLIVPEMRREIHLWRDWQSLRTITRMLRELKPDIVHTHSTKAGLLGRVAAKKVGTPLVIHTIHGPAFHPNQLWLARWATIALEKYAARFTHQFITVGDVMAEQSIAAGIAPKEKFRTIYSGMDVRAFVECGAKREPMRGKLGFAPEHVVIGKVARIQPLKGYEYVVEAAARLCPQYSQLRFLFLGDGNLTDEMKRKAQELGVLDRITFAGLVPAHEVPDYLSAMDLLVHASLREGLARVLPQALIAGKPVISFDVDGAREVVLNGQTGFLVEAKSVDGLAEAAEKILRDPELGRRMGKEGQERFTRQFDKQVMVDDIDRFYQEHFPKG